MSNTSLDLWPENLGQATLTSPAAILKRQATLLADKTKGLLEATVRTQQLSAGSGSRKIRHSFVIVAPALGNYEYTLFWLDHPIQMYPLDLAVPIEGKQDMFTSKKCEDESQFVDALRGILSGPHTIAVVDALMAQSNALSSDAQMSPVDGDASPMTESTE